MILKKKERATVIYYLSIVRNSILSYLGSKTEDGSHRAGRKVGAPPCVRVPSYHYHYHSSAAWLRRGRGAAEEGRGVPTVRCRRVDVVGGGGPGRPGALCTPTTMVMHHLVLLHRGGGPPARGGGDAEGGGRSAQAVYGGGFL